MAEIMYQWFGHFRHRVSMLSVAAQGVMKVKEHPTHIILYDFATVLGDLETSLKNLQEELEVSSHFLLSWPSPLRTLHTLFKWHVLKLIKCRQSYVPRTYSMLTSV